MKMRISRIAQIEEGLYNKAFGEETDTVGIMLAKAVHACKGDFREVNDRRHTEAKAFWNATIALVRALKPEMLSPNRIPREVMEVVHHLHESVFGLESTHLWEMQKNFGFLPFRPHGDRPLYDKGDAGMNESAHVDKIAITRANHTRNSLIKAYREGAWDGQLETAGKVFRTEIMEGCYGPEDCR